MTDRFTIVTYVNPVVVSQTPPTGGNNTGNAATPPILTFLKGQPKALGTVQIMIGVVTFMFGIVLAVMYPPISVLSGIVFWGPLFYIISGSLTVAAEPKVHPCVVKGSLGMNVVSIIVSGTAIILIAVDCVVQSLHGFGSWEFTTVMVGVMGVLAVLSLLQFIVSIYVSAFGCRATCCTEPMVPVVTITQPAYVNPQVFSGVQDNPPSLIPPAYNKTEN